MNNSTPSFVSNALRRALLECVRAENASPHAEGDPGALFNSPHAVFAKQEILRAGRKLWERQYVDGNGGNISVRISPSYVLCTPTLVCKGDMTLEDISLVDMGNNMVCGERPQTSELLLHLEIYKAVPEAKAVIHSHPPYATAHAVAGVVPQGNLIPEQEVFVGPVALAPYETPGTQAFAETVLPYARNHNTILLTNHGVVCWADTVAHAEWYTEVVDTYCRIVMLASQLKTPLTEIPPEKINDLLARKKKMGLPDARFAEPSSCDTAQNNMHWKEESRPAGDSAQATANTTRSISPAELDRLVLTLTERVVAFLEGTRCSAT
ncbi:MAG: class II aldolase/adducin family protein [Acidobacteriaceae bacterium]